MTTQKLNSNYPEFTALDLTSTQKVITLRSSPYQSDDPLSWAELDNNFELLRYSINSLVDDIDTTFANLNYEEDILNIDSKVAVLENQNLDNRVTTLEGYNIDTRVTTLEGYNMPTTLTDFGNRITEVESASASLDTRLTEVESQIPLNLSDSVSGLDSNVSEIQTNLTGLSNDVSSLQAGASSFSTSLSTFETDLTGLQTTVDNLPSVSALPAGYVLADDYCVGDGVTDDRANLQAAIDSLGEKGGTVLLGNKTYLLASNDGTMPWDLIPDYINTDQSLRGNASDGSLDGTEDHTHPAFRLYAWFRDEVSDDAAGFLSMVGTWNGTEFSGGSDSAGFNYWAASNRAALSLWQGLYQAEYEGSSKDTRHVVVREHVTIRGCQDSCGPGVWRGDNIGAAVNSKGSYIKIRNSTTLAMKRDTALANLTVVNDGLNGLVSSFGGYGVRPSGDDVTIENCFIGGFEYGVYANWTNPDPVMKGNNFGTGGRLRVSSCNMDNINSILVAGSYDITYIDKVHSWPFLTGHPSTNPDQLYTWDWDFFNNRDGIAFNLLEVNDWTKITDCFSYGYRIGFNIKGGRNIILKGCGADNSSVGMTRSLYEDLEEAFPDPDYNVLPGTIGFNITRNFASSDPVYGDYSAQGITDTDGDGFINPDEKFYPGTGSACLTNCQAAAQETGYRFEMENNECATMTACQSWYCSTHISASASATVSVMNELMDTGGYKNPQGVGPVGIRTQDTARVLVTNVQWREISYGGTDYNFSNKTLGNNITVTGEQNV